jgi:wyosine [tRNA(Phe)-imidazoG37] synthetase (radical SAM superfamily)
MRTKTHDKGSSKKVRVHQNGNGKGHSAAHSLVTQDVAFGYPRDFLDNQFVYLVISPRAGGLSIGINVNPILKCNFQCLYCELDRSKPARITHFDVKKMAAELQGTFALAYSGGLRQWPRYANLPEDLLRPRHVSLSGDGEPTLGSHFVEALETLVDLRVLGGFPFFKIVLVTNSTALDRPKVQHGLKRLTRQDEVWAKLDGGTQDYLNKLNGAGIPLEKIMNNILLVGRQRPVVIQSLFPAIDGQPPPEQEVQEYAQRLQELKTAGADISLVQIYSATRPMARSGCSHLPLKSLSHIARTVRKVTGLRAEVF